MFQQTLQQHLDYVINIGLVKMTTTWLAENKEEFQCITHSNDQ